MMIRFTAVPGSQTAAATIMAFRLDGTPFNILLPGYANSHYLSIEQVTVIRWVWISGIIPQVYQHRAAHHQNHANGHFPGDHVPQEYP